MATAHHGGDPPVGYIFVHETARSKSWDVPEPHRLYRHLQESEPIQPRYRGADQPDVAPCQHFPFDICDYPSAEAEASCRTLVAPSMDPGQQLPSTLMHPNADSGYTSDGGPEWRREEHGRFMQALELYGSRQTGDEWKLITDFVGSRTMEEVRLHGRQYLQQLVQQLPPSPMAAPLNGYLISVGSQNDPKRPNYQVRRGAEPQRLKGDKKTRAVLQPGASVSAASALSAAAFDCALSMNVLAPAAQFRSQSLQSLQQQNQTVIVIPCQNGPTSNAWTFQEEKAFETALAGWAGSDSYPWTKIAAIIPGRTTKEVRNRFDEMVGDIAAIEAGEIPVPDGSTLNSVPSDSLLVVRQLGRSSLSRRAVPPPPIEVPPRSLGKVGSFRSGTSTRSNRGTASGIAMLSPTFLDMLADSEEKSPLPSFPGLTNLPSPLFSPTLLPAGSPALFYSRGEESAARGKKLLNADCSDDVKMEDTSPGPTTVATGNEEPLRSSTPRILNDFLAGDFKFDDPLGTTPIHRRKSPRLMKTANYDQISSTFKTNSGAGKLDVEMTDASAA